MQLHFLGLPLKGVDVYLIRKAMLLILKLPDLSACHPKAEEGNVPSEYAWVSWNLFQSIHSQSPAHISTGPQLPAPSNYLHPSTTWPLPSPRVTPSNVGPYFKVSFFLFLTMPFPLCS